MNPDFQTFSVSLRRANSGQPWGFRLQGGIDFSTPLSLLSVTPGSLSEQFGLQTGDAVLRINNRPSDELEHEQAKEVIMMSGNQIDLVILRGAVKIWAPSVTPLSQMRSGPAVPLPQDDNAEGFVQRTSLAANKQEIHHIGSAHNRSARPFPGSFGGGSQPQSGTPQGGGYTSQGGGYPLQAGGGYSNAPSGYQSQGSASTMPVVVNAQYNTPLNMYSVENVAETLAAQTEALSGAAYPNAGPQESYGGSSAQANRPLGTRSVMAPTASSAPSQDQQQPRMLCKACGTLIVGVFVRIKGDPMHPECFKCCRCGMNLKNQGYFTIDGKLHCETHARGAANPSGGDMVSVPVYR